MNVAENGRRCGDRLRCVIRREFCLRIVLIIARDGDGRTTLVIVMSEYEIFSTMPPLPRRDLMRRPFSVPSNVQFFTVTLRTPPTVSLPMDMPCPCRKVQSVTVMSSHAKLAAGDFFAGLDGDVVVAHVNRAMGDQHVPAAARINARPCSPRRPGPEMVTSSTTTFSQSVGTK